jgi:hypothetical protein
MKSSNCSEIILVIFVLMSAQQIVSAGELKQYNSNSLPNACWQLNYNLRSSHFSAGRILDARSLASAEQQDIFAVQTADGGNAGH